MKKIAITLLALLCTWTFALSACSAPINPVNVDGQGNAIKGYDPVAYFTMGHPVKGKEENAFQWQEARWLFASSEHLEMFKGDPEKFAPQYGGY